MRWMFFVAAVALSGCYAQQEADQLEEYHRILDKQIGHASEEQVADSWGPPDQRQTIGDLDYWVYSRDLGSRAVATTNPYTHVTTARSVSRYDKVTMKFRGGVLVDWHAAVQR